MENRRRNTRRERRNPLEHPVGILLAELGDLIFLNLLWLLCSLPLVTVGASTSALYAVCLKKATGESPPVFRAFFHHFKQNFKQATALWLLSLGVLLVGAADLYYAGQDAAGNLGLLFSLLGAAGLMVWAAISAFAWPLTARYTYRFRDLIRNAVVMTGLCWRQLLGILGCWLLPGLLVLLAPGMTLRFFGWALVLWGVSGPVYLAARFSWRAFLRQHLEP